jgi:VanZ family protein
MATIIKFVYHWGPSILVMAVIFKFSSTPGNKLPNFGSIDYLVKKGGHILGYGILSLSNWHGLKWDKKGAWWAWIFAVLYAVTDEFHQSFVPGRHSSAFDVILFDATGAAIALWIKQRLVFA